MVPKMTPKTRNFEKTSIFFAEKKNLGKYFDLFSRNLSQNFQILVKKRLILQDFGKNKKKSAKKKIWVGRARKTGLSFFRGLFSSFFRLYLFSL